MERKIIVPSSKEEWLELRAGDITSTEVGALFGISPYVSHFELWHRKKERAVVSIEESERMEVGTFFQDTIAQYAAKKNGWFVRRMDEYITLPELKLGSSFDFCIEDWPEKSGPVTVKEILEIKNVDSLIFKNEWPEDEAGNVEAPLHIEMQVQHQLAVSGCKFAHIGAMVGGNRLVLIRREADPAVHEQIFAKVAEFWKSIEANEPPAADFMRDADFISKLYGYAEPGKIFDARGLEEFAALMARYKAAGEAEKAAGAQKDAIKAEVLTVIGDSEKVLGERFSISAGMIGECPIAYTRKAYRSFKPTFKKEKA